MNALAAFALGWPGRRAPPPPPPPPSFDFRPTLMAVLVCWVLPAVLLRRAATKSSISSDVSEKPQHRGVALSSFSVFLAVSAAAVQFPFLQTRRDALGCDAMCQGGQTSLRSGLGLLGAALIGRASDQFGRIPMLWLGTLASRKAAGRRPRALSASANHHAVRLKCELSRPRVRLTPGNGSRRPRDQRQL